MKFKRRNFLQLSALTAGSALAVGFRSVWPEQEKYISQVPGALPITLTERKDRIHRAQQLLQQNELNALVLESGSSLEYFTGISWWPSERTMVVVIPSKGEPIYVCPAFEESRLREKIIIGTQVYVWQEDENPFELIAKVFTDLDIAAGKIGVAEDMRFFVFDGMRKAAPGLEYTSGDPVTIACRLIKSAAELALMQKASDITVAAMKTGMSLLKAGISQNAISDAVNEAHVKLGSTPDFALVLFGKSSALPHGSKHAEKLNTGDIVLMDCGCKLEGYSSDITRTIVFGGNPTKRQQQFWDLEQQAQAAGFAAAQIGQPCEAVDNAARSVIVRGGLGPGYQLPGLPHRTGHGIGLDGHEWGNMVKGNMLKLQPGMCFSIEPTIAIPGEFGVRMEDCVYMTDSGPKWFSEPAVSIDKPF